MTERPKGRLLLQQCQSARLRVSDEDHVSIGSGVVAFVCFLKGADRDTAAKLAKTLTQVRLSETGDSSRVSVVEAGAAVLVVPQATLGGKFKGKCVQYHSNLDKAEGEKLYEAFVQQLKLLLPDNEVHNGTYGRRQELLMSNEQGPYSHICDV